MDFSNVKKLTIEAGDVRKIEINGVVVWELKKYGHTNLLIPSECTINKRINSSKAEVTYDGVFLSNFIPCTAEVEHILRYKGFEITRGSAGQPYLAIHYYSANSHSATNYVGKLDNTQALTTTYDENGDAYIAITPPSGTKYIRIQGNISYGTAIPNTDALSKCVVTLDEEITYTNVLELAVDANGNIYNGKGWKENTRISTSSGYAERELTGVYLTGYIAVKSGDVVRFKNITFASSDYANLVYAYNSSKTGFASVAVTSSIFSPKTDDNGNVIQITIPSTNPWNTTGFVRFNAKLIKDTSIITVNEKIDK